MPEPIPQLGVIRAPDEVIFAPGAAQAISELVRRRWERALLVTDPVIAGAPGTDLAGQPARRRGRGHRV